MAIAVRLALPGDVPYIAGIEHAAGQVFRTVGMPEIADDDPLPDEVLVQGVETGLLWVAVDEVSASIPVAYLLAGPLDDSLHIEQVTVHPDYTRRAIGGRLIDACSAWASANGYEALTLTTFRDVPWNGPYYQRLGFGIVPEHDWTPALRDVMARERVAGLGRWARVVMRRAIQAGER